MPNYNQSVDLGGSGERSRATITVEGSDERVTEVLGRLHVFLSELRAEIRMREQAGTKLPCQGCGDK